jgi:hypothetical protein
VQANATKRMALLAAGALLALASAGCAAPAADGAGPVPGATSSAPAGAPPPPTGSPGEDGAAPATTDTPVRVEGSTAAGACAAGQCRYELADTAFGELPRAGVGLRLAGTLTWEAVAPTSETLTVYVPLLVDGEYQWAPGYPAATGTSPLVFDLDLSGLNATDLGLIVGNGVAAGSPLGVFAVQTPQPFSLEATYTSRTAA